MIAFLKKNLLLVTSILVSIFFILTYRQFIPSDYLKFSDTAKVADVARNLYEGKGLGKSFSFFNPKFEDLEPNKLFAIEGIPVLNPYIVLASFKLNGISDFSAVLPSILFYITSAIVIYLIGERISGKIVGFISSLAFSSNLDMIRYASEGASESLFILEILTAFYVVSLNKRKSFLILIPLFALIYLTRPQAFVFIFVIFLYWLILVIGVKKALLTIVTVSIVGLAFDKYVLAPLSFKIPVYSITARGEQAILYYSAGSATSNGLRGGGVVKLTYTEIGKKLFYNSYNFYKLLPQVASPYLIAIFIVSLFVWSSSNIYNGLKISAILSFLILIFTTSLTIPLIRYLHPAIPLIYLFAVDCLVKVLRSVIGKKVLVLTASILIITIFSVGQTLGVILLDSRFENNTHNFGKPATYKVLSQILKENTEEGDLVLTNLDTWGTWYGHRKTVWYPLAVEQVLDKKTGNIPFDSIYLTSYLIDDENYYMGEDWRKIFNNPQDIKKWDCEGCDQISKNFKVGGIYMVSESDVYERQDVKAVLLVRK